MGIEPKVEGGGNDNPLSTTSLSFPILVMMVLFGSYALYLASVSASVFYFMLLIGSSVVGFYFLREEFDLSLVGLGEFNWSDILAESVIVLIISVVSVAIVSRVITVPPTASLMLLPFAAQYSIPSWEQAFGGALYFLYVFASSFFVAFCEGITFTGGPPLFVVNSFISSRTNEQAGNILTSVVMGFVFATFHFIKNMVITGGGTSYLISNFPAFATLFTLGVIWSMSSFIFKNSLPQIFAHTVWNVIAMVGKAALLAW
jgi:membrane protease YdiL (CAAX protease family)